MSSECSTNARPTSRVAAPNPARSVVMTRSPRSIQADRSARSEKREPGVPGRRRIGRPVATPEFAPRHDAAVRSGQSMIGDIASKVGEEIGGSGVVMCCCR